MYPEIFRKNMACNTILYTLSSHSRSRLSLWNELIITKRACSNHLRLRTQSSDVCQRFSGEASQNGFFNRASGMVARSHAKHYYIITIRTILLILIYQEGFPSLPPTVKNMSK